MCDTGKPADEELIKKAEQFLGVRFPMDYREFLRRWGSLAIGPLEFYGIAGEDFKDSAIPNGIWYTNRKRKQVNLPWELVVLYDNNGDELYCLDTSNRDDSRIVVWDVRTRRITSAPKSKS